MTEPTTLPHSADVAFVAALSGAASLLPIPFVDDAIRTRLHAQMFRTLAARKGKSLDDQDVEQLLGKKASLLGAAGKFALLYPAKRLFRRLFGVLAITDVIDEVSKTYHLGFLFAASLEEPSFERRSMAEVRAAIDATVKGLDPRPVRHLFRGAVSMWSRTKPKHAEVDTTQLLERLKTYGAAHFEAAVQAQRAELQRTRVEGTPA